MIDQVAADIMVLQEVGSLQTLTELNARLKQPYEHSALVEGNSNRSIHIGVLARAPLRLTSHRDHVLKNAKGEVLSFYADAKSAQLKQASDLVFFRDLVQVEVLSRRHAPLTLFCVHLKSRTNQAWQSLGADEIRAAECRAVAEIVASFQQHHPQAHLCVLGDFNDRITSEALTPLALLSLHDPLGDLLKRSGRNPSTYWPKRRMRIDHILLSASLLPLLVADSPQIHVSQIARTASDHYPVSITLSAP